MATAQAALRIDREAEKAEFLARTFWCTTCLCTGCGLGSPCPFIDASDKCLCARSKSTTGEECCGDLGCISGIQKTLCCISMVEFPPDPLMVACCNAFVVGNQPGHAQMRLVRPEQYEQMAFTANTFWCCYCCCWGYGLTSCNNPLIKGQNKFLCIRSDCETADLMNPVDGMCYSYTKVCCFSRYLTCPPNMNMTPGCGCCNSLVVARNLPAARQVMVATPTQIQMM